MANMDFDFFNSGGKLSLSEVQDKMIGMERKMNYGMRNLDSLNVKRLNTEITIIKSEGGEMDLTGRNIKMYDETSRLRFRVGLSTSDVYDMTMWSSNTATTDYDASSNASMYINSSGEATFADRIRTRKDAVVGQNLYVGFEQSTDVRAIRLRSFSTASMTELDFTMRALEDAGFLTMEFGILDSTDGSTEAMSNIEFMRFHVFQPVQFIGNGIELRNGGNSVNFLSSEELFISGAFLDLRANAGIYLNHDTDGVIYGDVLLPYARTWQGDTNSTSQVLTGGFAFANYVQNVATTNQLGLAWTSDFVDDLDVYVNSTYLFSAKSQGWIEENTVQNVNAGIWDIGLSWSSFFPNDLDLYVNSSYEMTIPNVDTVVQNVSTDRQISLDVSTVDGGLRYLMNSSGHTAMSAFGGDTRHYQFEFSTGNSPRFYRDGTLLFTAAQVVNSTRNIQFDLTTALDNLTVFRNSTAVGGIVMAQTTDAYKFSWNAVSARLEFYENGVNQANFYDQARLVQNASTDRRVDFDFTTAIDNLTVSRNSTILKSVVLSETTNKISLDWSTADAFPTLLYGSTIVAFLARSAGAAHKFEWSTASSELNLQHRGISVANFIDKGKCVQNQSTGNLLSLGTTAMGSGIMMDILRGTSQIGQPIMDYTTGLNVQVHMRRLTSTEAFFPTTGVWLIYYSSGTFMGKTLLGA